MLSMTMMGPRTLSVLISTLLIASAHSSKKLNLNIIPSNGEIYLGEAKYFMCKASQEADLKWMNDDGEVESDPGRYELKKVDETLIGLNITLSSIEPDQVITCKAETDSGEESEEKIRLSIIQKPKIISDFGKKQEFNAGASVKLPCLTEGIPKPKISWMHNGESLSQDPGRVSVGGDGSLQIGKIQLSDAGPYSCRASIDNRNERDQKTMTVIVNAAPVIHLQNDRLNASSKSNTSLTCSVTGNPAPQVNWRRYQLRGRVSDHSMHIQEPESQIILCTVARKSM
uniref:Ig-like domain-containing protein n=1 Tax=Leptobrachium leishanense TaxID=445787 RepID=A0A8C5QN17_9ANUR